MPANGCGLFAVAFCLFLTSFLLFCAAAPLRRLRPTPGWRRLQPLRTGTPVPSAQEALCGTSLATESSAQQPPQKKPAVTILTAGIASTVTTRRDLLARIATPLCEDCRIVYQNFWLAVNSPKSDSRRYNGVGEISARGDELVRRVVLVRGDEECAAEAGTCIVYLDPLAAPTL